MLDEADAGMGSQQREPYRGDELAGPLRGLERAQEPVPRRDRALAPGTGQLDIRVQGDNETVFFDI